jgi:hypothetical protein
MKAKHLLLTLIALIACFYIVHPIFFSTKIIGVHQNGNWTDVVVKNFPITDRGKVEWWKKNLTQLKLRYNTPEIDPYDGGFEISIWDIGNGYQKEAPKQDWMAPSVDTSYLICFDDMKMDANCVEKDRLLSISHYRDSWHKGKMVTDFSTGGNTYRQYEGSDKIIKVDLDENVTYTPAQINK